MARFPVVGGDTGAWGTVLNTLLAVGLNTDGKLKGIQVLDLLGSAYGVTTGAWSSGLAGTNNTAIQQAFTDAAAATGPTVVYARGTGQPIPTNTLTLPSEPIVFVGDGPSNTVFNSRTTGLTYSSTTPSVRGSSSPWSSATASIADPSHTPYALKAWVVHGLGFTFDQGWGGTAATNGLDFPNWDQTGWNVLSPSADGRDALVMFMSDVTVTNFSGIGINYLINGLRNDSVFRGVVAESSKLPGVYYGSDQRWVACLACNNGQEGFWTDGRNGQLDTCKAYGNGSLAHTSRNAGFHVESEPGGGCLITNCYAQDNKGAGLEVINSKRVTVNGLLCERNCGLDDSATDTAQQAGVIITNSTDVTISGYVSTESFKGSRNNRQFYALRVTNNGSNARNRVQLVHSSSGQAVDGSSQPVFVKDPVDPASDLNGTNVIVGASDGGIYTQSSSQTSIRPDPTLAQENYLGISTTLNGVLQATPAWHGAKLRLGFMALAGTRTLPVAASWSGYRLKGIATNGASGLRTELDFVFDGPSQIWNQVGAVNIWA